MHEVVLPDEYDHARHRMVEDQLKSRGIRDRRVLETMAKAPRHRFVPMSLRHEAYGDFPLSIGEGQTISQPYMVALMTEALELAGTEKVLEIGTGSGYQTAILAELAAEVYTVERIPMLLDRARNSLHDLGYENVSYKVSDGTLGWPDAAPFDAIIVTAGAPHAPEPLTEQLSEGGRLVIPVGNRMMQDLMKVTRRGTELHYQNLGGCRFVDLIGVHGWRD